MSDCTKEGYVNINDLTDAFYGLLNGTYTGDIGYFILEVKWKTSERKPGEDSKSCDKQGKYTSYEEQISENIPFLRHDDLDIIKETVDEKYFDKLKENFKKLVHEIKWQYMNRSLKCAATTTDYRLHPDKYGDRGLINGDEKTTLTNCSKHENIYEMRRNFIIGSLSKEKIQAAQAQRDEQQKASEDARKKKEEERKKNKEADKIDLNNKKKEDTITFAGKDFVPNYYGNKVTGFNIYKEETDTKYIYTVPDRDPGDTKETRGNVQNAPDDNYLYNEFESKPNYNEELYGRARKLMYPTDEPKKGMFSTMFVRKGGKKTKKSKKSKKTKKPKKGTRKTKK
jgi:hypothetical protein